MRAWWWAVLLSGCAHVASTPRAPEQWSDEPPAAAVPVETSPEPPRVGPVVGVHLGASLGNIGPDFGGRLGARVRIARHLELSALADAQWSPHESFWRCKQPECPTTWRSSHLGGQLRLAVVSDGRIGRLFVPAVTLGAFVGAGVFGIPALELSDLSVPPVIEPFFRAGLHLGVTRLPNGWWFPVFLELATLIYSDGSKQLAFLAGVGL